MCEAKEQGRWATSCARVTVTGLGNRVAVAPPRQETKLLPKISWQLSDTTGQPQENARRRSR